MSVGVKKLEHRKYYIDAVVKRNGKQFRRREFVFTGSESQAQRRYAELYAEAEKEADNFFRPKQPKLFADLIEAKLAADPPPASYSTYYNRVRADCGPFPLSELQTRLFGGISADGKPIAGYIKMLDNLKARYGIGAEETQERKTKLSAGAKNKIVMVLKQICVFGYQQGILSSDPMQPLYRKSLWKTVPRNRTLRKSDNEFLRLLNKFNELFPDYTPLFVHSCRNPGRISDLRKLTVDNLYLFERKIRYVSGKKKVPCTHIIYDELIDYFTNRPPNCPYLFYRYVKKHDMYLPIGDFKKAWAKVKTDAKVHNLRWHDLRHQAATWLAAQEDIKTHHIMAVGGWLTRQMVEVYHNLDHEATADEAVNSLLKIKDKETETDQQKAG